MELDGTVVGKFGKAGKQLKSSARSTAWTAATKTSCGCRRSPRGACRRSSCIRSRRREAHHHVGSAVRGRTMKRILTIAFAALLVLAAGHAISAQQQFGGAQLAVPEIPFDSVPNFLKLPDKHVSRRGAGRRDQLEGARVRLHAHRHDDGDARRLARRSRTTARACSSSTRRAPTSARLASASTGSCSRTSSASTRRTTSGSSTRARTW